MPDPVIHLLTGGAGGDLRQAGVACGAPMAHFASWSRQAVTCPNCLGRPRQRTASPGGMREKQFQELVRQACGLNHWVYYHTHSSRHSPAGLPDVIAVREGRLLFAELKRQGQAPTPEQQRWLAALAQVRTVEVYVWTEDDMAALLEVLR